MLNLFRDDWDAYEPRDSWICHGFVLNDVIDEARAKAKPTLDAASSDLDSQRKARDSITQKLNNAAPGAAPKIAPTLVAPATQAAGVAPVQGTPVANTMIGGGRNQTVKAPDVAPTGPVTAQTIAAPKSVGPVLATAATVGPAATATKPTGIGTTLMAAAPVQQATRAAAATVGPIAEATAPTVARAAIDTSQSDEVRAQQMRLADLLTAGAEGRGPTAADSLLAQSTSRAVREQMGLAVARSHGGSAGLAQSEAARNISNLETEAGFSAAQLRAKEQQDAQSKLIAALEGTRGADASLAGKAADLASSANLTQAQLQGQTGLANLDVRSKTALTDAQMEQEARQANAAREQQTNLTASQLQQEANKANSSEMNLASRTTYATEAEAAQAQAARDQAVLLQRAANQQQVNLLNPQEQNRMSEADMARQLEAAKANQASNLSAATTTAQIGSAESIERAQLQAKVSMDNAQRELSTLQKQADLDQQNGIHNADLAQQIAIKKAELEQATNAFNAGETNKLASTQATITSNESQAQADAVLKQRQIDQQREQGLIAAQLNAGRDVTGESFGAIESGMNRQAAERQAERAMVGEVVGGGAKLLATKSDKRSKKDIADILMRGDSGDDELMDAFAAVHPVKFRYKEPYSEGARPGPQVGVLAQDLEKNPLTRTVVTEKNGEKMIDTGAAVGLALAAIADMRKQMASLKKGARR